MRAFPATRPTLSLETETRNIETKTTAFETETEKIGLETLTSLADAPRKSASHLTTAVNSGPVCKLLLGRLLFCR